MTAPPRSDVMSRRRFFLFLLLVYLACALADLKAGGPLWAIFLIGCVPCAIGIYVNRKDP